MDRKDQTGLVPARPPPAAAVVPEGSRWRGWVAGLGLAGAAAGLGAGCDKGGTGGETAEDGGTVTVGFIYVGQRTTATTSAHDEGAAAVRQMPGVKIVEMENVKETNESRRRWRG